MKIFKNININIDDHLGFLTLNRQEENNSLNIETSKEIYEGLKELEMNSSIRVVLIQGNRKFFSPGADINELAPIKNFDSYNFLVAKLAYKILSYTFEFKN